MSPLVFDPGVGKATAAMQSAIDRGDTVWIEQAIVALARLAPIDAEEHYEAIAFLRAELIHSSEMPMGSGGTVASWPQHGRLAPP
jgi:hypothetical protein